MKLALATLMLLGATLASCGRSDMPATQMTVTGHGQSENSNLLSPSNAGTTLIDRIANSRDTTQFQGVRRVELSFDDGALHRHLMLRERVSADGHGAYAIEALEVVEPQMSPSQRAVFLTLQSVRQGMNWRYRDFAIRDVPLFLQNYVTTDTGLTFDVAGHACMQLKLERMDQSGSSYTLGVDGSTGLVLSSREETLPGLVVSEMTYESIDFAPDLSGVAWHQSTNNERPLPIQGRLRREVGYEIRAPRNLPAGYQLLERTSLLHPQDGSSWVKATYGDGVESLFFLDGGPIVGGNGIRSGVPEIQADLVEVTVAAPWTVARGNLRSERVISLGKVSEQDLVEMLRSAFE